MIILFKLNDKLVRKIKNLYNDKVLFLDLYNRFNFATEPIVIIGMYIN